MDICDSVVIQPLCSIDALLDWKVPERSSVATSHKLSDACSKKSTESQKLLVCHDRAGGYHEDRFLNGTAVDDPYYLTSWQYIDIFVYFSHSLVTIPPIGWINCAHLHGVSVLGTFITEFEQGEAICNEFLKERNLIDTVCEKLAQICSIYGFDGWLLNIENPVDFDLIQNLLYFAQKLTETCKAKIGSHSLVIWYDSVTVKGELKWQNELNEANEAFFLLTDGIFVNYTWKEANLGKTVSILSEISGKTKSDVFVGVDVYGRGCLGGGGFSCDEALHMISKFGLSTALFAPAWSFEHLGTDNFAANDMRFWAPISKFFVCGKIRSLPLTTNFHPGKCKIKCPYGCAVNWFDLSRQQIQPHWFCFESADTESTNSQSMDPNFSCRYAFDENLPQGVALCFSGRLDQAKPFRF